MQISQNQYQILVYNSEFGQKIKLAYTKSKCIGFRITSSIAVIIGVIYELQKACSWHGWGWVKMFSELA